MGTIIGMIEPYKLAFSAEITAINGIFRKPPQKGTTNGENRLLSVAAWIDILSMKLRLERKAG
ncbi:hypothetical protein CK486_14060 [Pseudomonas sp. HAR-UPW-AIA-41]|uniref:hypothetical protein n=1 Tax=Pseudomonas sp. HAR-UPW-AIA-41 TaxID=1985301 RepID=UPI000BB39B22|nr:hypothetical protein [Pseudomonas sp. HAR-UPW-AIA-41]PAV47296.1 hypothetical protein CK486_14060 [Pseudomonas sp. HAR-UPW-AIA-41]